MYICYMKSNTKKAISLREQIMQSMIASFKIEGIDIPQSVAEERMKIVELNLEKSQK